MASVRHHPILRTREANFITRKSRNSSEKTFSSKYVLCMSKHRFLHVRFHGDEDLHVPDVTALRREVQGRDATVGSAFHFVVQETAFTKHKCGRLGHLSRWHVLAPALSFPSNATRESLVTRNCQALRPTHPLLSAISFTNSGVSPCTAAAIQSHFNT